MRNRQLRNSQCEQQATEYQSLRATVDWARVKVSNGQVGEGEGINRKLECGKYSLRWRMLRWARAGALERRRPHVWRARRWRGLAWLGVAWRGMAWHGVARRGMALSMRTGSRQRSIRRHDRAQVMSAPTHADADANTNTNTNTPAPTPTPTHKRTDTDSHHYLYALRNQHAHTRTPTPRARLIQSPFQPTHFRASHHSRLYSTSLFFFKLSIYFRFTISFK